MMRLLGGVTLAVAVLIGSTQAAEPDKKDADTYVKVEAKGKLRTGIVAIGGETTGVLIRTAGGEFEVELDKKQRGAAEKLNNKTVMITGTLYVKPGVTRGPRTIIKVATIKEAK